MPKATYENLPGQSITVSSAVPNVTFSNIDQTYTDLILVSQLAAVTGTGGALTYRINGMTTTDSYRFHWISYSGTTRYQSWTSGTYGALSWYTTPGTDSHSFVSVSHFMDYAQTNKFKTTLSRSGALGSNSTYPGTEYVVSTAHTTSPITSIEVAIQFGAQNIAVGSTFTLYGIRAE